MRMCLAVLTTMLLAAGCGATIEVKGALPAQRMKLAVMDFHDAASYKAGRDYTVAGASGSEHPDILVARAVRRTLAKCPNYEVMSWVDMRRALKLKDDVQPATDADALALAKTLGVDAVAVGDVQKYKQTWALQFFSWASVAFTVHCLDASTGKELWSARVEDWRSRAIEEDLAADLSRKLYEQLRINTAKRP